MRITLQVRKALMASYALLMTSTILASGALADPATPIDTNAPYYLASQLGATVLPDFEGGTLRMDQAGASYGQNFSVENFPSNTVDTFGNSTTMTGILSGTGGLKITGGGTLTLSNANTFTGGTTISSATLQIGGDGSVPAATGSVVNNGNLIFDVFSTYGYASNISGTGSVAITSNGVMYFTGTNTYSGGTTISHYGSLSIGDGETTGSLTGNILNNGSLRFDRSDTYTFSGDISGSGSFDQNGGAVTCRSPCTSKPGGTLILTGTNTYTGSTWGAGTLQIGDGGTTGSIASSEINVFKLIFDRSDTIVYGSSITANSLEQRGSGTLVLTSNEIFINGRIITISAGTLQIGDGSPTGRTISTLAGVVTDNSALVFDRSDIFFPDQILGNGSLRQIGSGTLIINSDDTYTGGTTISSGVLQIGDGGASFPVGGGFAIYSGGNIGSIVGDVADNAALAFNRVDTYTFPGNISGTGSVQQLGTGTTILTGTNTYTSGTTISAGTLQIGNGGTTGSITGNVSDSSALAFDRSDTYTFAGVISGTGSVAQIGTGTTILTGANTYTGGTTVLAGTLQIGNGGTTGSISGNVTANSALTFDRSDTVILSNVISGTGSLQQIGTGTLILTGTNTYTGGTSIASGKTLEFIYYGGTIVDEGAPPSRYAWNIAFKGGPEGAITGDVVNSGMLALVYNGVCTFSALDSGLCTRTFSGNISGTGKVLSQYTPVMILTGSNSYSGDTQVIDSNLVQGAADAFSANSTYYLYHIDYSNYPRNSNIVPGTPALILNGYDATIVGLNGDMDSYVDLGANTLEIRDGGVFNGAFEGTGALKLSGGSLLLTGNSMLSGSTVIGRGATLQLGDGGSNGAINGWEVDSANLIVDGTVIFDRSDTVTLTGPVSGGGTLQKIGTGTLRLTGTNTYTGGTIISGGTLQIGDGGTSGAIVGDVIDNAILAFNRSDSFTLAGNISGTGSVQQIGTGTTILTGTNTYTGGTTISAGPLQIGDGGTAGSITGDVTNNGILAFNRSDNYALEGNISGPGVVNQIGTGTTILNGMNTYSGLTTVSVGTLEVGDASHTNAAIAGNVVVNAGATLSGHGAVMGSVTSNGGTVAPGGSIGTLTVASYTQNAGSTLSIEVGPNAASSLVVSGAASLNGTLNVQFDPGAKSIQGFNFLTAGSVGGQFVAQTSSGANDAVYDITYGPSGFAMLVQPTKVGQIYSDLVTSAIDSAHALNAMIVNHDVDKHCTSQQADAPCPTTTVWARTFAGAGSTRDQTGAADDFGTRRAGFVGGIDYHLEQNATLGLAFSYSQDVVSVADSFGRALGNLYSVALDGRAPVPHGQLDAALFYTSSAVTSRRDIGASGIVSAHPSGHSAGGTVQYTFPLTDSDFTPLTRLSFVQTSRTATVETGVDSADLAIDGKAYSSLHWNVGIRYNHVYALEDGLLLAPELSIGLQQELLSLDRGAVLWIANSSQQKFLAPYASSDWTAFTAAFGVELQLDDDIMFRISGDGRASGHQHDGIISLGGRIAF